MARNISSNKSPRRAKAKRDGADIPPPIRQVDATFKKAERHQPEEGEQSEIKEGPKDE